MDFIVYKGTWEPITNLFESDTNTSSGVSLMINEFEKNYVKNKKEKKKEKEIRFFSVVFFKEFKVFL